MYRSVLAAFALLVVSIHGAASPLPQPEPPSKPEEPAKPAAPAAPAETPKGIPVPGKPGFVYSPYSKEGIIDVTGFPPGTKVRCPYTNKAFLVP